MFTPVSKQFRGDFRGMSGNAVQAGAQPVDPPVDPGRLLSRKIAHGAGKAVGARHPFGHPPSCRPARIGDMVRIAALAVDKLIDKLVQVHVHFAAPLPIRKEHKRNENK